MQQEMFPSATTLPTLAASRGLRALCPEQTKILQLSNETQPEVNNTHKSEIVSRMFWALILCYNGWSRSVQPRQSSLYVCAVPS